MAELETRGGRRFRPGFLLSALVAFVMGVALTSTWHRQEYTVGEGTTAATVYGALALLSWLLSALFVAMSFGLLTRR